MLEFLLVFSGFVCGAGIVLFYFGKKYRTDFQAQIDKHTAELRSATEARFRAESERDALKTGNTQLRESFESLAGNVLQKNSEMFLRLANESMNKYSAEARKDFLHGKETLNEMLKPLKETLDKHETLVKDLNDNTGKTFGTLRQYLDHLSQSQKSLERETGALVNALKSPKVRGRWGEIGLKRIVEFSGMSEYCDFEMQVSVTTDDGRLRPDMIVKLPEGKRIAVDSKVPLASYLEMLETDDELKRAALLENHAKAVVRHMKELASKNYWSQFNETVDFVVLYIEVEPAFGAALSLQKNLLSEAVSNRIVFATPTTLIALLQTVAYSWKQQTAAENAMKIWQTGKELFERMVVFSEYFQKIGSSLSGAIKAYNAGVSSWESRVLPSMRKMENLGGGSEKKSLSEPDKIDLVPRE